MKKSTFGDSYIDSIAKEIQEEFPGIKGFNRRGLYRMKQFYETYAENEVVTPLVTQISWTNHLLIMSGCKSDEEYNAFVKRDKEIGGVYKDKFISSFFYDTRNWFIMLHDIRTQETHYEVGKIEKFEGKIYYVNGNRNGTSKNLYTNPSDEIKEIAKIIDEFLKTEDKITKLVISSSC